jgi:hypothetical protein
MDDLALKNVGIASEQHKRIYLYCPTFKGML